MLTHPTIDRLRELGRYGMATAFQELDAQSEARVSNMASGLPSCWNGRPLCANESASKRATAAKLRHDAQIESLDFRAARGLDRNIFMTLAGCDRIKKHHSLRINGPAGVGKSWLACAIGHKAFCEDFSVAYHRVPRLFASPALARGDGRYGRILKSLAKTDLLILDDWGPEKLNDDQRHDVLEIIEDRYERRSTIVTNQVPLDRWYEIIAIRRSPTPSSIALFTPPTASSSAAKA